MRVPSRPSRAAALLLLATAPLHADTIEVPGEQPTVQAAIDAAIDGDLVLVAPGTYVETLTFAGKAITVASHAFTTGDPAFIATTILDADGVGSVVRFENGETRDALLTGFTLTGGDADYGGGIHCAQASPTLRALVIRDNVAVGGAGIHIQDQSSPLLQDLTIRDNATTLTGGGGGVRCVSYSHPELRDVRIESNLAQHGGGMYVYFHCDPVLTDVRITGNVASTSIGSTPSGGGLFVGASSNPRLERVILTDNVAGEPGVGLSGRGGAIHVSGTSAPVLVNVTMAGNLATFAGGALHCLHRSAPRIVNAILWDNLPQEIYFDADFDPDSVFVAHSTVKGGQAAIADNENGVVVWLDGNLDDDPAFVDLPDGDVRLAEGSPCIDTGTAFFMVDGETLIDLDDDAFEGAAPDMGAIEWSPVVAVDPVVSPSVNPMVLAPNPTRDGARTAIAYALDREARVRITLHEASGRELRVLDAGVRSGGRHEVRVDLGAIPPGVHLVRLSVIRDGSEVRTASRKLVRLP